MIKTTNNRLGLSSLTKRGINFALISALFVIFYAITSLENNYQFRTYALDLGAYTHFMWEYIHFRMPDTSMFSLLVMPSLADHFDLYLVIFSPFVYLFGSYTLLIIQVLAVFFGGVGLYKLAKLYTNNDFLILMTVLLFYSFFGIFSAFSFDYHSNVVAAMFVPWIFYYLKKQKYGTCFLMVFLACIGKENISLWLLFVFIALMWDFRKSKKDLLWLAIYSVFSLAYFLVVTGVVMPKLNPQGNYHIALKYTVLGGSLSEMFLHILKHPFECVKLLFVNHLANESFKYVKLETMICLLTSGALFLFFKPNYLIMLVPLLFQKMFADSPVWWSVGAQYSVEFAPIVAIGMLVVLSKRSSKLQNILSLAAVALCIATTIYTMGTTQIWRNVDRIRFYQKRHYVSPYNVPEDNKMMKEIPSQASVTASSSLVPHLALRQHIYSYPFHSQESDFLVLSKVEGSDYVPLDTILNRIERFRQSGEYTIVENADIIVLKKDLSAAVTVTDSVK